MLTLAVSCIPGPSVIYHHGQRPAGAWACVMPSVLIAGKMPEQAVEVVVGWRRQHMIWRCRRRPSDFRDLNFCICSITSHTAIRACRCPVHLHGGKGDNPRKSQKQGRTEHGKKDSSRSGAPTGQSVGRPFSTLPSRSHQQISQSQTSALHQIIYRPCPMSDGLVL
jgi:hypothetical protein